jgi:hypothetical protein
MDPCTLKAAGEGCRADLAAAQQFYPKTIIDLLSLTGFADPRRDED